MDPDEAARRFADMLEEAGLPRFASAFHDPAIDELQLTWEHGLTIHLDLSSRDVSPIDDSQRAAILGLPPDWEDHEPIDVYVPGSIDDPRDTASIPGVMPICPSSWPIDRFSRRAGPVTRLESGQKPLRRDQLASGDCDIAGALAGRAS